MEQRWLAFRDHAGASLSASLLSTLPIGKGWRGGHLLISDEIVALDQLVRTTADQVGAALGMWQADGFSYGVAAQRDQAEIPFLMGFEPTSPPARATDAVARCGVGPSYAGWRQHTAQTLSAWSVQAPRTADALEVDAVLQIVGPEAVETFCRLFGMAVPVQRELDAADQAAIARATLAMAAERKRKRRSFETIW